MFSHELNGSIYIQQGVTYHETGMFIITAEITPNVSTYCLRNYVRLVGGCVGGNFTK